MAGFVLPNHLASKLREPALLVPHHKPKDSGGLRPGYAKSGLASFPMLRGELLDYAGTNEITLQPGAGGALPTLRADAYGPYYQCDSAGAGSTAGDHDAEGFDFDNLLSIPAGADFTFYFFGRVNALNSGNAGFWRSVGSNPSDGGTFCIFNGSNPRPWIRLNGTNVLQGVTDRFTLGDQVLMHWVVRSGVNAEFWVNGRKVDSATHSVSTAAFNIRYIGHQYAEAENVEADYHAFGFASEAFSEGQILEQARHFYGALLKPANDSPIIIPAAAGGEVSATTDTLAITDLPASIKADVGVLATSDTLSLTNLDASVTISTGVQATTDSLTITDLDAAVALTVDVAATVDALAITDYAATISTTIPTDVQTTADALSITDFDATVVANVPTAVLATLDTLAITDFDVDVSTVTPLLTLSANESATFYMIGGTPHRIFY